MIRGIKVSMSYVRRMWYVGSVVFSGFDTFFIINKAHAQRSCWLRLSNNIQMSPLTGIELCIHPMDQYKDGLPFVDNQSVLNGIITFYKSLLTGLCGCKINACII